MLLSFLNIGKEYFLVSLKHKIVHKTVMSVLQEGLDEANIWTVSRFDGDASLLKGAQGLKIA